MKKITIISLHLGFGGIEKYISNLCKMLENDFIIHIICVYKFNDKSAFDFSDKIEIKYLVNGNPKGNSLKKYLMSFNFLSFFKEVINRIKLYVNSTKLLKKELISLSTDYVITTRIKHHKLVNKYIDNSIIKIATEHNYHMNNNNYINNLVNSISNYKYLIVPTNELYSDYKDLTKTKCIHISNQIDNISKKKSNLKTNNIIAVGRFSEEKGFLDLIDIFKLIHKQNEKIKLFLLGDGHLFDSMKAKINDLGLNENIILPGFVSPEDQAKYYFDSSLYVMTSYTEAFGLVLVEAMAYGLPIIAFDSASGVREIVNNRNGKLISSRNKEKMADEIIRLLNNKVELKKKQKFINNDIIKYSESSVKKEWLKILK